MKATMQQIMEEGGLTSTVYQHLNALIARGLVEKVGDGYALLAEAGEPATAEARPEDSADDPQKVHYAVSLVDLVQAGLLHAGDKLLMEWKPREGDLKVFEGTITASGEIALLGEPFASPSRAAVHAMQTAGYDRPTENGWQRWKTGAGVTLAELRERFLRGTQ